MEKVEPGYYRIEQAWSCALHIFFFCGHLYSLYVCCGCFLFHYFVSTEIFIWLIKFFCLWAGK